MAYAAVISLKRSIQHHINPTNPEITDYVYERLNNLGNFFRRVNACNFRNINKRVINAFDAQIREAVCKLEDALESYVLRHSHSPSDSLQTDEESVEQEIDSFLETVDELEEEFDRERNNPLSEKEEDDDVSPIDYSGRGKSTTVGLSDQSENIKSGLDWDNGLDRVQVISLVGIAGIGKTHLVRNIYQDPVIVEDFEFTAWVSAGPIAETKSVMAEIVAQIKCKPRNLYMRKDQFTLAAHLKQVLSGRRYLIVLDDVWTTDVSILIASLPYVSGSQVILTTRLEEVAKDCGTRIHHIRFMNNEESWDLLWQNVFADSSFPPQLEKVGRKIADKCEGLPLFILAVAHILRGLDKTQEYWDKVASNKTTTFRDASAMISKTSKIHAAKIINLWIAEDFFEPSQDGDLQDFSVECLEKLVSNSVVIACKRSYNNRVKSCRLHSAYWYFCVKEARENKFYHVLNKLADGSEDYLQSQRRLSIQNNVLFGLKEAYDSMAATLTARSLLCTGEDHEYPVPICFNLMFLKVLDALSIRFYEFPIEVVKLLLLRYLALTHNGKAPSSISNLQHLQCLIVRQHHNIKLLRHSTCLPKEIWDMKELTYLRIMGSKLSDPSPRAKLPNLVTLHVNAHSCTKAVFRSIPNLRKLGIKIELQPDASETFSCFKNIMVLGGIESVKCVVVNPRSRSEVVIPSHHLSNLPKGLKKLSLNGLGYSWKDMSATGSLPNLKVLKLRCYAFQGVEWETKAGKFSSLEFLLLEDIDLVHWKINGDKCFPRLQCLTIQHCFKLKMIPPQIGTIRTLEKIELVDCGPSVVASANKYARSSLKVVVDSSWSR